MTFSDTVFNWISKRQTRKKYILGLTLRSAGGSTISSLLSRFLICLWFFMQCPGFLWWDQLSPSRSHSGADATCPASCPPSRVQPTCRSGGTRTQLSSQWCSCTRMGRNKAREQMLEYRGRTELVEDSSAEGLWLHDPNTSVPLMMANIGVILMMVTSPGKLLWSCTW